MSRCEVSTRLDTSISSCVAGTGQIIGSRENRNTAIIERIDRWKTRYQTADICEENQRNATYIAICFHC